MGEAAARGRTGGVNLTVFCNDKRWRRRCLCLVSVPCVLLTKPPSCRTCPFGKRMHIAVHVEMRFPLFRGNALAKTGYEIVGSALVGETPDVTAPS